MYVMLDLFSRYVVGWMVMHRESATLAERLVRQTCEAIGGKRFPRGLPQPPACSEASTSPRRS
jgi:transposase InsO family protein